MKKIEYTAYGGPEVFKIKEVEKPIPENNEVLIKMYATSVTATECIFRKGIPYFSRLFTGLTKPKITTLGEELAGEIEEVGKDVTLFKKGERVFGSAGINFGANAEYICMPEDGVMLRKPDSINYEEAACSVDGFLTALPFLRDTGCIQSGQKVLINGASGSIGVAAVQIARYFKAEVTGVCSSANVALIRSLGADNVIDYTKEDFTRNGRTYDIIFDTVGKISFSRCRKSLTQNGVFLNASINLGAVFHALSTKLFSRKKLLIAATGLRSAPEKIKDLHFFIELLEQGAIKPVIDRSFPLEQISEAHRYVDKGHKKGNVAITIR